MAKSFVPRRLSQTHMDTHRPWRLDIQRGRITHTLGSVVLSELVTWWCVNEANLHKLFNH